MKKWLCKVCGYIYEGPEAPAECPVCHAKSNMFEEVKGELKLAAEHEFGVYGKTVKNNPDISEEDKKYIFDQLMANFNGECSEVGMYLCMARVAHREGYPEIGLIGAACAGVMLQVIAGITSASQEDSILMKFSWDGAISWRGIILALVLLVFTRYIKKTKDLHPIVFIGVSAVIGVVFHFAGV